MNHDSDPDTGGGRDGRVSEETAADLALISASFQAIERERAEVVQALARVRARGDGEAAVGMPIEQHLAWTTRQRPGTIHGMSTVVDVLGDLPSVRHSYVAGDVSFEQVKAVAYAVVRATRDQRGQVDTVLAGSDWAGWDPDAIEFEVGRILLEALDPVELRERDARRRRTQFVNLQPTLDGQGLDGRFRLWDLDAGLVDAVLQSAAGLPTADVADGLPATRRQRSLAQGLVEVFRFWQAWSSGNLDEGPDGRPATKRSAGRDRSSGDPIGSALLIRHPSPPSRHPPTKPGRAG